ncbi:MAG: alpha/beta hydrolase [Planctomycetota bacterium]
MPLPTLTDFVALLPLLGLGLLVYTGALVFGTAWSLTHPPRHTAGRAIARGRPTTPAEMEPPRAFASSTVRVRGHDCPAWTIEGRRPTGPVAILTPGWGDSRLGGLERIEPLEPLCRRILLWDSPGMGEAPGTCSLGAREAGEIIEVAEQTARGEPVLLVGWSMGAGAAIEAAAITRDVQVIGVVAEAPYREPQTPAKAVLRARSLPVLVNLRAALAVVGLLSGAGPFWRRFNRARLAERVRVPLLVLHGGQDPISPLADGRAIAGAAPLGELAVIDEGAHNDLWSPPHRGASIAAVSAFVDRLADSGGG